MNRLGQEKSPYLLQHANNPVDWYPWGDEAFARARAEDKPIFLSIGYSTCHWCHVMERESFESPEVAALMNDLFVNIKVDREERPDVDRVYMSFVQATTGGGGWPMSVWLTPELKPFYGGTYYPPRDAYGRPGFPTVLQSISRTWRDKRADVVASGEQVLERLREIGTQPRAGVELDESALADGARVFARVYDERYGGFGQAPKFPRPVTLALLMRTWVRSKENKHLEMVVKTLRAMADGGMYDHLAGGFHRYSVDRFWHVPHFEKMLYDQAQLVLAFVEAAQLSGDPFYAEVAEDTLLYVMREMTDEGGGFYSAEDADSIPPEDVPDESRPGPSGPGVPHKKEGAFYLWRAAEVDALLGDHARIVKLRFGIEPEGNAPQDPQQEFAGKNLLFVARSIDEIARDTGTSPDEVVDILHQTRLKMFKERLGRPRPERDDKILAAWNGLMIAAFARMARALRGLGADGREAGVPYLDAARRAAAFVRERMWNAQSGVLLRRYRGGHAEIDGYAEDYAYLIYGLLELFQADPQPMWLEWAIALQRRQDELFWDEEAGGWFSTTGHDPSVLLRMKEDYDGAEPTASSVSVLNLLALSHLVTDPQWDARIERTLKLFATRLEQMGRGVPMMAAALSTHIAGVQQIVIAEGEGGDALDRAVAMRYLPFAIQLRVSPEAQRGLAGSLPFLAGMQPLAGITAAYVCRDFTCRQPVTTVDALEQELGITA